jgi:enamine deaminase RidA (YjgF/YER057c/UK114 family)
VSSGPPAGSGTPPTSQGSEQLKAKAPAPEIIQPPGWPVPQGYSNAVAASGRQIYLAGQVGWDPLTGAFASDDLATQAAQALANVAAVLKAAGAEPRHLTRLTWYVTDRAEYLAARQAIGTAYRAVLGRHYPAMSLLVVHSLLEERAKVEIEATAVIPHPRDGDQVVPAAPAAPAPRDVELF